MASNCSTAPFLKNALDTDLGRRLPRTMRRLALRYANGEAVQEIADTETLAVAKVKEIIRYAAFTLNCHAPEFPTAEASPGNASCASKELNYHQFMVGQKCGGCGIAIEADDERIVVAPMRLQWSTDEWNNDHYINPRFRETSVHYCLQCATSLEQFYVPNAWFVTNEERARAAEVVREFRELEKSAEQTSAENDQRVAEALAKGDVHEFDRTFSTHPKRDDLLARSVLLSQCEANTAGTSDSDSESTATGHADDILSERPWPSTPSREKVKSDQREAVRTYLDSQHSRGLRPNVRKAARLWTKGATQTEIANKLAVDQSFVSRMIRDVIGKAQTSNS